MSVGKVASKLISCAFKNPLRKGAKKYEEIPMLLSLGWTGVEVGCAMKNLYDNNSLTKDGKNNVLNATIALSATAGSVLGPAGTILGALGMGLVVNQSRREYNL